MMSSNKSNETNSKNGLQAISIRPLPPVVDTPHADAKGKSAIREYYSKGDWNALESFCDIQISGFIKDLPSPILSGSTIDGFHFGAIAFKNLGKKEKYLACLKVLFSLKDFASNLSSEDQRLLMSDINEYHSLSKELGVDYLNNVQVAEVLKKSGGCFIATACYGTDTAPDVLTLRTFRDNILLSSKTGRAFVDIYYLISPPIAKMIASRYLLRSLVRQFFVQPIACLCRSKIKKDNREKS